MIAREVAAEPGRTIGFAARVASMGYAVPGAVIAVGVLLVYTTIDHAEVIVAGLNRGRTRLGG